MARIWTELKDEDLQEVSGGTYLDSVGNELQVYDYVSIDYSYFAEYLSYISCIAWCTQFRGFDNNGNAYIRIRYTKQFGTNGSYHDMGYYPLNIMTKSEEPYWVNH